MKKKLTYIKNTIMPCFLLSSLAGGITGALIFLFKMISSKIISLSESIYRAVRSDPRLIPILILCVCAVGIVSGLILKRAKDCRGGGIPTAVASIRGLIPLKWIQGIFVLFFSSMLTYLCGVPLGNEGPSVQMGAAVGKGASCVLNKENRAWQRYVMTGGACAGFATATGAPLTGILFALEEVHRRFSPMIFMSAATAVLSGSAVQELLSMLLNVDAAMFSFKFSGGLALRELPIALLLGAICAASAIGFTLLYKKISSFISHVSKKIPFAVIIMSVFLLSAVMGLFSSDLIGSGHSLIHHLAYDSKTWYFLAIIFILRAITMIFANTSGVSGGVFLPILTFGAIIGSIFGGLMIRLGVVSQEAYPVLVALSMSAFLGVASRTPITAVAFAAEALCGVENILPVAIAVTAGYIIAEIAGIPSFNDTIIESKAEAERKDKCIIIVDTHLTVCEGSFADRREMRDILWPPTCAILSIDHAQGSPSTVLAAGDILHIHYATASPKETQDALFDILGKQDEGRTKRHFGTESHIVPEV